MWLNRIKCYLTVWSALRYLRSNYPGIYNLRKENQYTPTCIITFQTSSNDSPATFIKLTEGLFNRPDVCFWVLNFGSKEWKPAIDQGWHTFIKRHLGSDLKYHIFTQQVRAK